MNQTLVLRQTIEPGIERIVLNDPDARNAMSDEMGEQFAQVVRAVRAADSTSVVILSGSGKAFSGGGHLEMLFEKTKLSQSENRAKMEQFYNYFLSIVDLEVPVIAEINGHAIGAGFCLALACDIRVAGQGAKLGLNFVQLGLHPGMGATYFLPRLIGPAKTAELLYTGSILTAEQAESLELVNYTVPSTELSTKVLEIARAINSAGPESVRSLKRTLRVSPELSLAEALRREAECQAWSYASAEFLEGIQAAREKRPARFGGAKK